MHRLKSKISHSAEDLQWNCLQESLSEIPDALWYRAQDCASAKIHLAMYIYNLT